MKKILPIILVILAVAVVGRSYYKRSKVETSVKQSKLDSSQQNKSQPTNPPPVADQSNVKTYTMKEVADHGANYDYSNGCWTVIHDKVYDITEYTNSMKHPGGESIFQACGSDATVLFETRPIGTGTPHSANARSILDKYYIGDLKK